MGTSNAKTSAVLEAIAIAGRAWSQQKPGAREGLLALAHSLNTALETPSEAIQRIGWAEPAGFAATRLAVDLRLFEKLSDSGDTPMNATQLAKAAGADTPLISRTLKHLAAMNIIGENGADEYVSTPLSDALTIPKYRDGIVYCYDVAGPSFRELPAYLKQSGYKNPHDLSNGPFQYAHKTKGPFWAWLGERPAYLERFNNYMSGYRQGKPTWTDANFYPVSENLGRGLKENKDAVLLVDIGGGLGHDLEDFKGKYPQLPGRLILQERPEVIAQITETKQSIEPTVHDFFTPQPVKGAKAYYLHSVLHDWDDETSIKILKQIVSAMEKGYSKLLIHELVVPDAGASWSITSMDWLMMALGAVRERTEKQWHDLLASGGLRIVKVWTYEQGTESLIEAELDA